MVVLLRNGRALALKGAVRDAQALLVTWFLGSETGHAVADVLFGDASPSGRLPVSFPREPGQVPYYHAHPPTGRPVPVSPPDSFYTRYLDSPHEALYPFGHGLSYTTFAYSAPRLSATRIAAADSITVQVDVRNTGPRAGDEVVQMYVRDDVASVTRPVRELRGFERITLEPGQSRTVSFTLRPDHLAFYNQRMQRVVEPGFFTVWVGASSADDGRPARFEVVGEALRVSP